MRRSIKWNYFTLDALYRSTQMGGIVLQRDWDAICAFDCMDFDLSRL